MNESNRTLNASIFYCNGFVCILLSLSLFHPQFTSISYFFNAVLNTFIVSLTISLGKTGLTFPFNTAQHCWIQHVQGVWPPFEWCSFEFFFCSQVWATKLDSFDRLVQHHATKLYSRLSPYLWTVKDKRQHNYITCICIVWYLICLHHDVDQLMSLSPVFSRHKC